MIRRLGLWLFVASLTPAFAVDKNMLELQREVGLLQDQVRQLQQSQTAAFSALQTIAQQALDAAIRADRDVAVIQSGFQQNGKQLTESVVTPVVGLSTRMDQVSGDVRTLQQAIADLTSTVNKIGAQLSDVNNAIKVLSAPPPAPAQTTPAAGAPGATGSTAPNTPPMSQTDLYNAANADYNTGKLDLALQEYQDFLKYYATADLAPNAQYGIGQIYYTHQKYDDAVQAFDMVLERYPENNNRMKDAMYYKGMSLVALHKFNLAHNVFQDMEKKYPNSDTYVKACTEDKSLGMNCYKPPASSSRRKK